jgi:Flp pilus assembly protein TadB
MLTPEERARFHTLRDRHDRGETLSEPEAAEVERLTERLETQEAAYLAPVIQRLREQNAQQAVVIARLERYYHEKRERLNNIRALVAEIESIEREETHLLATVRA